MYARRRGGAPHTGWHDRAADDVHASAHLGRPVRWLLPFRRRWRLATARFRVLPDFVIVGAQKAGTTSLYAWLTEHPEVVPAASKEVHFFDSCDWYHGVDAYRASFPLRAHLRLRARLLRRRVITGEATPYYLYHPLAPERLAATVPDAKIIILLRDPVERALSHYGHEVRGGRETLPLRGALAAEADRLGGGGGGLRAGEPPCHHLAHRNHSYVERSRYRHQVARYRALFPTEQVLVLRAERLFAEEPETKRRLADFLGLPALTRPFAAENLGHRRPSDAEEESVRDQLARELAEEQAALALLTAEQVEEPSAVGDRRGG